MDRGLSPDADAAVRAARDDVLARYRDDERVVGVGIGRDPDGTPTVQLRVAVALPEVPTGLGGVPVRVRVVGRVTPHSPGSAD